MIDRLIYAATSAALAVYVALDGTFAENATRAFGGIAVFLGMAAVAL